MDEDIKKPIENLIYKLFDKVFKSDLTINEKLARMDDLKRLKKIIDNFDELEPLLSKYFEEKARKDKWGDR